ncbi:MobA/MobL family protein, partial [Lysinibacillus sp. OL1_EC]
PEWVQDRNRLWNEVEKSETRKNSQLAREINVALPRELSNEQQTELIKNYVQTEFVNKGMVADIAIHRDDKENPHAHVMMTTREISEEGFTVKNRDWNDRELLNQWREQWADHANKALEKEGIQERISHLSHEARGLEQMPTVHLGHVASAMEKEGKMSDRGNINRDRQEYNRLVVDLQKYREEKQVL